MFFFPITWKRALYSEACKHNIQHVLCNLSMSSSHLFLFSVCWASHSFSSVITERAQRRRQGNSQLSLWDGCGAACGCTPASHVLSDMSRSCWKKDKETCLVHLLCGCTISVDQVREGLVTTHIFNFIWEQKSVLILSCLSSVFNSLLTLCRVLRVNTEVEISIPLSLACAAADKHWKTLKGRLGVIWVSTRPRWTRDSPC